MAAPKGFQLGRHIRNVGRLAQIANVFARHGFYSLIEKMGLPRWLTPEQAKEIENISKSPIAEDRHFIAAEEIKGAPARFRAALEELGPAFVKLGQVLAVRQDLLPSSFTEELSKLHQHVSSIPFTQVKEVLQADLGEGGLKNFKSIDEQVLAAGSIAQVHKAYLSSGEPVVIKVQRPNILHQIEVDIALMDMIAGLIEKYIPESKVFQPKVMIEEFSRSILGELDFIREGGNTSKMAANFSDIHYVCFPKVFWEYSTKRVLTLSYMEGHSVWDKDYLTKHKFDPELLVERGLGMFLQMVFVDGLYHGDLHPGNLLVLKDNKIGIIDCGLTVYIARSTREHLAGLLIALIEEDYDSLVSHFIELSQPASLFDEEGFRNEIINAVSPFIGLNISKINAGKLLWHLARIAANYNAPMPRELILFFRTLVAFEGIGRRLNPHFEILSTCQKFSKNLVAQMYSRQNIEQQTLKIVRDLASLARYAPRQIRQLLKAMLEGELGFKLSGKDLQKIAISIDRSVSRLAVSIILAAIIIASAILVFGKIGDQAVNISLIGLIGFSVAGILGMYIIWSIMRSGKF